jgi:Aminotransferase class-V
VGQRPVDVAEIECDFLSATDRKFLRGPRGTGLLFVSGRVLEACLEPLFIDMRGCRWTSRSEYRPVPDAARFEDWELRHGLLEIDAVRVLHRGADAVPSSPSRSTAGDSRELYATFDRHRINASVSLREYAHLTSHIRASMRACAFLRITTTPLMKLTGSYPLRGSLLSRVCDVSCRTLGVWHDIPR